jgi:hypothetical protein
MDTPGGTGPLAPPDAVDPWWERPAKVDGPDEWRARARRRKLILILAAVVLAFALIVGGLVWMAELHYDRGQKAYAMGAYDWAVSEFSAARLLVFPYRDAARMEREAKVALDRQAASTRSKEKAVAHVLAAYRTAARKVAADDAAGVLAAVESARTKASQAQLRDDIEIRQAAADLQTRLRLNAIWALEATSWHQAGLYASSVLVLDPVNKEAQGFLKQATTGENLQARFARALAAARARKWAVALALARSVLSAQPGFPGAANLVAEARVALRPKRSATHASAAAPPQPSYTAPAKPGATQPAPP